MRAIKLYFAGAWPNINVSDSIMPKNRLVSFAYPRDFFQWLEVTGEKKGSMIIDSGAFSAWNKNDSIDIDEYIKFAHEAIEKGEASNKIVHVVNLDEIPGKVGQTASLNNKLGNSEQLKKRKEMINKAAAAGLQNMLTMKENGITPIHVFHQGEDWEWLDKMLAELSYIGISPANDMSRRSKKEWIESVFEYMHKNGASHVDTHGFAVTAISMIRDFPWTSCDSASWKLQAGFGSILYPAGGFSNDNLVLSNSDFASIKISEKIGGGRLKNGRLTQMIKQDGYTWEALQKDVTRYEVNLRFFHKMEKDLNKFKKHKNFKPKKRFL